MSPTERDAIEAGTVWWDAELFSGRPHWDKLLGYGPATLTAEEQSFLDVECERLCDLANDWETTMVWQDLSPQTWQYIKESGFLGMIIPKQYGGRQFSAYAHSQVIMKLATRCSAAAVSVMVPNSLGPAELLMHYGTEAAEEPLSAASRARRRNPLLRVDEPLCRFRRSGDSGRRHRLQGHVRRPRDARLSRDVGQALHHARADRDRARPRVPRARSRPSARRRRRTRHHLRADSDRPSRA